MSTCPLSVPANRLAASNAKMYLFLLTCCSTSVAAGEQRSQFAIPFLLPDHWPGQESYRLNTYRGDGPCTRPACHSPSCVPSKLPQWELCSSPFHCSREEAMREHMDLYSSNPVRDQRCARTASSRERLSKPSPCDHGH